MIGALKKKEKKTKENKMRYNIIDRLNLIYRDSNI